MESENLESQRFERIGESFKCRECGEEKFKHTLIINCPRTESKSIKKCFRCWKFFTLEYVLAKKGHSFKNDWDYWTKKKENKGKSICNSCLLNLYRNDKKFYLQEVQDQKKRRLFRVYVYSKVIS